MYFRGHEESLPLAAGSVACRFAGRAVAVDFRDGALFSSFSEARFSGGVGTEGAAAATLLKSNAVPGVLGVLVAEPNDAKAPEPSPKAVEPLVVVGDDIPLVARGVTELNGLFRPCDDEPSR